jgi:hypothetical protein
MAIVLLVIGLLSAAGLAVYRPAAEIQRGVSAAIFQQRVEQALFNFALTHHRLPCADTTGDGYEAVNCPFGAAKSGAVPYATLGLTLNGLAAGNINTPQNMIYGIYRNSNADPLRDADLAVVKERTGDTPGTTSFHDVNDFRQGLINAMASGVSKSQVYVTGDSHTTGNEDCNNNAVANAAFWLASPGAEDMDANGSPFDGVNENLKRDGSGTLCFASPTRLHDAGYDDLVNGTSFSSLLGRLSQVLE